jgi:hypothetical protein
VNRKTAIWIAVGSITIAVLLGWCAAQADELVFVDPWNARARLIIVPERQVETIIIRTERRLGVYQEKIVDTAVNDGKHRLVRAYCEIRPAMCSAKGEEDGNQEKEAAGVRAPGIVNRGDPGLPGPGGSE